MTLTDRQVLEKPAGASAQARWPRAVDSGRLAGSVFTSKRLCEVGERRTALAYEPAMGRSPVARIAVEFDERGQWAVVVDGVILRFFPDAASAIEDARRLEALPSLAASERDDVVHRQDPGPR